MNARVSQNRRDTRSRDGSHADAAAHGVNAPQGERRSQLGTDRNDPKSVLASPNHTVNLSGRVLGYIEAAQISARVP